MGTELTVNQLMSGTTNPRMAKLMEECAALISAGFPVMGMDLIPQKNKVGEVTWKVYINRHGAEWLINRDDRGVRSIATECLIDAMEHQKGYGKYRCEIVMGDGSRYVSHGSAMGDERWKTDETAETRSIIRCVKLATAQTLLAHNKIPLSDEDTDMPRFGQTMAARATQSEEIKKLNDDPEIEGARVTILSRRQWERGGTDGSMARVATVQYLSELDGKSTVSDYWINDKMWDQISLALMGDNGAKYDFPITDAMFTRHEVTTKAINGRPSRTVFVWDIVAYPTGDYDPAPDSDDDVIDGTTGSPRLDDDIPF